MFCKSRSVLLTAVFTVGALALAAMPARAESTGLFSDTSLKATAEQAQASFLTAGMVQGQAPPPGGGGGGGDQGFGIGVKGGYLTTTFDSAATTDVFNSNNGWMFGVWFGGNRNGLVGVQGEIMYAKKGSKEDFLNRTLTYDNYYLEIPILARINIGSQSRNSISVYGLAGPVFDVLLKAEQDGIDIKDNYESLDIGVLFGGGIEISRLLLELRYNRGLKNVLKGGGGNAADIKTHTFAILAGVRFN